MLPCCDTSGLVVSGSAANVDGRLVGVELETREKGFLGQGQSREEVEVVRRGGGGIKRICNWRDPTNDGKRPDRGGPWP
jgi:hypothetical protein